MADYKLFLIAPRFEEKAFHAAIKEVVSNIPDIILQEITSYMVLALRWYGGWTNCNDTESKGKFVPNGFGACNCFEGFEIYSRQQDKSFNGSNESLTKDEDGDDDDDAVMNM